MRSGQLGYHAHWVCPRLLELDERHGHHAAHHRYPPDDSESHKHHKGCGCLMDWEGHSAATIVVPPGETFPHGHPRLTCKCGRELVEGEVLTGHLVPEADWTGPA